MTKQMQKSEMAVLAHAHYEKLLEHKRVITIGYWGFAQELQLIRDEGYFTYLGYDSFKDFVADPAVSISESYASKLISCVELSQRFEISQERLLGIDVEKVYLLSQAKDKNKDNIDEWVEKARLLSRSDMTIAVQEAKNAGKLHEHVWVTETWEHCSCGMRRKVNEVS